MRRTTLKLSPDDEQMPEHGCTISSPCEPNDSLELKSEIAKRHIHIQVWFFVQEN